MDQTESFDVVILGSGQGGKLLAWHLASLGKRVAVVERQWIGGSCPAVACLPSKNEVWSAHVAATVRHAGHFGTVTGPFSVDMAKVLARKQGMIDRDLAAHRAAYEASGAELIMGTGSFISSDTLEVTLNEGGSRRLRGEKIVINVGTHALIPDVPGLRAAIPLTHIEALELDRAPEHLIVLGGGYTGIEMAQAFRRFGSRVTIVEQGTQLLAHEDLDVAEEVLNILRTDGIEVLVGARLTCIEGRSGVKIQAYVQLSSGPRMLEGTDILVSVGRVPNTAGIGLEAARIAVDDRGYVQVDGALKTNLPNIWAIGEAAGSPQFTHASFDDFRIVRDNLAGGNRRTDGRLVPNVVFIEPQVAHVGLRERDAQREGRKVRMATLPLARVMRTMATDQVAGFMKVLVGTDDDRILGFTMVGPEAGEVMAVVQTAMIAGLPYTSLRDAVLAHLTFAEGLAPLLARVPPRAAG